MAIYTQFAAEATLTKALDALGNADLLPVGIPTATSLNLAALGYETLLTGLELQYQPSSGEFLGGILSGLETRFDGKPLYRFEGMAFPVAQLNSASIFRVGLVGNDTINGSPFADLLYGGDGADRFLAGTGDDELFSEFGSDLYDGGLGLDRVLYDFDSSQVTITAQPDGNFRVRLGAEGPSDTLTSVEYAVFTDRSVSLLDFALGAQRAPDAKGVQVFRFANLDNGQYFYTGSVAERDQVIGNRPNFRYEGAVFSEQDDWVTGYLPVYRFATKASGGYFYTASSLERDYVLSEYTDYRYEGVSFFAPASADASTVPVYRLANLKTGGYLYTASAAERQFAKSLGFFRDEGIGFNAPQTIAVVAGDDALSAAADPLVAETPVADGISLAGGAGDGGLWLF